MFECNVSVHHLLSFKVVGVLGSVAFGKSKAKDYDNNADYDTGLGGEVYDANINQGGNNNYADYNEGGQAYNDYSQDSSSE